LAPATIRQIHAILRASLNQAEHWGLVQRVARLASAPSQSQREQHPPELAEVLRLMAAAVDVSPMFGLFIRVMVATGVRANA
jgi:integrase